MARKFFKGNILKHKSFAWKKKVHEKKIQEEAGRDKVQSKLEELKDRFEADKRPLERHEDKKIVELEASRAAALEQVIRINEPRVEVEREARTDLRQEKKADLREQTKRDVLEERKAIDSRIDQRERVLEERAQQEDVLAEKRAELPETARPQIEEKAGQAEELQESASVEAVVETQAASVASELKAAIEAETVEQVADTAAATGTAAATEAVAYTSALSFEFGSTAEPIVSTAAITPVLMDAAANNEELGQLSISTDRATAIDRSVIEQSIAGRVDTLEEAIAAKTFLEVPTGITDRTEILDLVRFEQTKGDILGTIEDRTDIQSNFIEDLHSQSVAGIGAFVDADMEAASAKLQALQVQQQLGIQSLSIANEAPENIMALFG
ncbi:hypothetical protein E1297_28970 [Roseibium sp. RKSG952]|nr:hypothetical protein [Roseibium sp. RKSG952]